MTTSSSPCERDAVNKKEVQGNPQTLRAQERPAQAVSWVDFPWPEGLSPASPSCLIWQRWPWVLPGVPYYPRPTAILSSPLQSLRAALTSWGLSCRTTAVLLLPFRCQHPCCFALPFQQACVTQEKIQPSSCFSTASWLSLKKRLVSSHWHKDAIWSPYLQNPLPLPDLDALGH